MIDLHCHILSGVDDGSPDVSESIAMAQEAHALGMKWITATPHVMDKDGSRLSCNDIHAHVNRLQADLDKQGISIKIFTGAEYYLDRRIPALLKIFPALTTLNGTHYLLVEMPGVAIPDYMEYSVLDQEFEDEQARQSFLRLQVIIAHPERNAEVMKDWKRCVPLVDQGYILQVNLGSLIGMHGRHARKAAEKLLKTGYADLVSTDAHNAEQMRQILRSSPKALRKIVGEQRNAVGHQRCDTIAGR